MSPLLLVNATPTTFTCRLEPWPLELSLPPGSRLSFDQDRATATEYLELDLTSSSGLTLFGIDRSPARIQLDETQLLLYPPSTFRRAQPPRLTPPSFADLDQAGLITLVTDRRTEQPTIEQADTRTTSSGGARWLGFPAQAGTNRLMIAANGLQVSGQVTLAPVAAN